MKEKIIAIVILSMFTMPVLAQNISSEHFSQQVFSSQNTHQVAELSHSEMKDTKGRFGPWGAALGGFTGGLSYITEHQISGEPISWGRFAFSVGTGAVAGAALPTPTAMDIVWGANQAIAAGTVAGIMDHYGQQ